MHTSSTPSSAQAGLHNDAVALTQALVRMDTINPPGHEDQCTHLLADLLRQAGFACRFTEFSARRSTLVAKLGGRPDKLPLCFTGHVDVVPLGAAPWTHPPFGADIVDDRLYGRGASDMKSGVAAFVVAAIGLAHQIRESAGVTMVITAGEETGCEGAFHLANSAADRDWMGQAGALVVAEPTANAPFIGHKGAFWLKARAQGVTAHGSMPEQGDNAVYKVARAATALEAFRFAEPEHVLMGHPTLNVGTIAGGLNINSVPDAAELTIDIRTLPGQDHAQLHSCLCAALGAEISLHTMLDVQSVYTPPDEPWIKTVFAHCQPLFAEPLSARSVSYFTDAAALLAPLGSPPTVILGPGEPQLAHQTDEYCKVSRIHESVDIFAGLIRDWCQD